jgi:hypothetical protein
MTAKRKKAYAALARERANMANQLPPDATAASSGAAQSSDELAALHAQAHHDGAASRSVRRMSSTL